jgi:hypothetical protein
MQPGGNLGGKRGSSGLRGRFARRLEPGNARSRLGLPEGDQHRRHVLAVEADGAAADPRNGDPALPARCDYNGLPVGIAAAAADPTFNRAAGRRCPPGRRLELPHHGWLRLLWEPTLSFPESLPATLHYKLAKTAMPARCITKAKTRRKRPPAERDRAAAPAAAQPQSICLGSLRTWNRFLRRQRW